jgi:FMN phosphatase YigB (HAD superfamily)
MPIRCVTFDWGDTLATNYSMPYKATNRWSYGLLAKDLAAAGLVVPSDWLETSLAEMQEAWRASVDRIANPEHREIDYRAITCGWITRLGGDPQAPAIAAALDRADDRCVETVIPFAESQPTLRILHERGLRIGILSHVPWPGAACRRWYVRHGLAPFVDFYSLSSDVGVIKPNPGHYAHTLAGAGCAAHEVLHVGDHPWRDVEGGRLFGFRTCLRETEGIYPVEQLAHCAPDHRILHLREVLDLV